MGFESFSTPLEADDSKRVNDPEKAEEMAYAGRASREAESRWRATKSGLERESADQNKISEAEAYADLNKQWAENAEERAGGVYDAQIHARYKDDLEIADKAKEEAFLANLEKGISEMPKDVMPNRDEFRRSAHERAGRSEGFSEELKRRQEGGKK